MSSEEENRKALDQAAAQRARDSREERSNERAFNRASPEQQAESRMRNMVDAAVQKAIAAIVIQGGKGISVTGGSGNFTIAIDVSALSLTGSAVVNCDADPPTVTMTFALK